MSKLINIDLIDINLYLKIMFMSEISVVKNVFYWKGKMCIRFKKKNILKQIRNTYNMVWANHTWPEFQVELFRDNLK